MTHAITIDAAQSKDLDDAIWAERKGIGWAVTVVIANVGQAVGKGSRWDTMAYNRVATRYFAKGNAPMLPRPLAEDELSLLPGQPRKAMVIRMTLSGNLVPEGLPEITVEDFASAERLSYGDVPQILKTEGHALHKPLTSMSRLAEGLMARRREAGALAFYDLNAGWVTTEDGLLRQLKDYQETIGYVIVQELMILANAELARFCADKEIPILFRNHTAKLHAPNRNDVLSQLELALRHPLAGGIEALRQRMNLSMNPADYGVTLLGHYGLNLPAYMHATSPIRRFADLVNQRQVLSFLSNPEKLTYTRKEMEDIAAHINAKIQADKDDTTDFYKERDTKTAMSVLSSGNLSTVEDVQFERVAKTLVRQGDVSGDLDGFARFKQAIRDRMVGGRLSLLASYYLLLESPRQSEDWTPVQEMLLKYLQHDPPKAVSVASVAMNLAGWSEVRYDIKRVGAAQLPEFAAQAEVILKGGEGKKSTWQRALNSKLARQHAVIDLVAGIVGLAVQPVEPKAESVKQAPTKTFVPTEGADPVASLQEYTQHNKLPLPEYSFVRAGGPDHAPLFTCACVVRDKRKLSRPQASKKNAKKEAARLMLVEVLR